MDAARVNLDRSKIDRPIHMNSVGSRDRGRHVSARGASIGASGRHFSTIIKSAEATACEIAESRPKSESTRFQRRLMFEPKDGVADAGAIQAAWKAGRITAMAVMKDAADQTWTPQMGTGAYGKAARRGAHCRSRSTSGCSGQAAVAGLKCRGGVFDRLPASTPGRR